MVNVHWEQEGYKMLNVWKSNLQHDQFMKHKRHLYYIYRDYTVNGIAVLPTLWVDNGSMTVSNTRI